MPPQRHSVRGLPGLHTHAVRSVCCSQPGCSSSSPCLSLILFNFLLALLVKTGLYFSSLGCAGLVQVVKRSKLSSFPNINTLLANNNYSTRGFYLLMHVRGCGGVSDGICHLLMFFSFS